MKQRLVVGSRGSKLALIQAESVVKRLRELNPHLEVSITKIVTAGDRDRNTRLDQLGEAIFVRELEKALLDKQIDLVVHSLKDVPNELPPGLCLLATPERLDPRDALVARVKLKELPLGAKIGTSSLRRVAEFKHYRPDIEACAIRGNVDTRLRKVDSGEYDGLVVAAAAMLRMGLTDKIVDYLPMEHFLPSVGQGALVVEAREDDDAVKELVAPLNNLPVWQSVIAERAFLLELGGGCRAPIGALGSINGTTLKLEGMIASLNGDTIMRATLEGNASQAAEIGKSLARKLLDMGAAAFIPKMERR